MNLTRTLEKKNLLLVPVMIRRTVTFTVVHTHSQGWPYNYCNIRCGGVVGEGGGYISETNGSKTWPRKDLACGSPKTRISTVEKIKVADI
jgi:hypothetical protein